MKNLIRILVLLPLLSACNQDVDTHFKAHSDTKTIEKSETALSDEVQPAYQPGDDIPATAYIEHDEIYNP